MTIKKTVIKKTVTGFVNSVGQQIQSFASANLPYYSKIFVNDTPYARIDVIEKLKKLKSLGYQFILTGGYGNGHVSKEHLVYATAVDMQPTGKDTYASLTVGLKKVGMLVYDEGIGTANHHIHTYIKG